MMRLFFSLSALFLLTACASAERNDVRLPEAVSGSERQVAGDLRQRAANLRNTAEQFEQEADAFRHEIPGGQPILQRKAVVADELRARAAALERKATMLDRAEQARSSTPGMSQTAAVNARFQHRQLAQELRQMAAERREEAALLSQQSDADPRAIEEKRQLADRFDAIAEQAEENAREDERKIPHGMVPQ